MVRKKGFTLWLTGLSGAGKTTLAARLTAGSNREFVEDAAWLLYDEARLMDGEAPAAPAAASMYRSTTTPGAPSATTRPLYLSGPIL